MNRAFFKFLLVAALSSAALQALAIGRVADVNVVDRSTGRTLLVHFHRGEYWIAGQPGAKYSIQVRNSRGLRVLAVTSVDGLNVLSGETADFGQSGYVFESGQRYGIEGWRKNDSEVAAFVFTASPGNSYAERMGKPHDMGVIGVALFREQPPVAIYSSPAVAQRQEAPAAAAPAPSAAMERADSTARKAMPSAEASTDRERSSGQAAPSLAPKLGTAHGEREHSVVSRTPFVRESTQPNEIIRIRYDSHANLMALGVIPSPRQQSVPNPNPNPGSPMGYVPDPPTRY